MIAEQALRAGEIVHRVRGFVRKGAGDGPVALNEVVRDMVRFAEFDARAHPSSSSSNWQSPCTPSWPTRSSSNRSSAIW
jgi:hypothetical protein